MFSSGDSLLTRYSTSTLARYFGYLAVLWYVVSLAMLFLAQGYGIHGLRGLYMWSAFLAIPALEAVIAGLVVSSAKTFLLRSRCLYLRFAGMLVLFAAAALLTASLFLCLVSWTAASQLGFITYSSIRSFFTDPSSLLPVLTLLERVLLMAAFCAASLITLLMIGAAPVAPRRALQRWSAVLVAVILAVIAGARAGTRALNREQVTHLRRIFEANISPSATLFWAPLLFPKADQHWRLTLPVLPRYGLETYAARIDRNVARPNILVFVVEALRADQVNQIVNGQEVIPTINKLAAAGLNFTHAYAPGDESVTSDTSVESGLHVLKYTTRDAYERYDYPSHILRVYDLLSPVYRTGFFSSANEQWQNMINVSWSPNLNYFFDATKSKDLQGMLPADPADTGQYQSIKEGLLRTGNVDDATTTGQLLNWIAQGPQSGRKRPFFAFVSYQASHFPYEQGLEIPARFKPDELSAQQRGRLTFFSYPRDLTGTMLNRYRNSLAYTDVQIGRILQFLNDHDLLQNTILVIFGDHGEMFYENGHVTHALGLYNTELHVAFTISGAPGLRGVYSAPLGMVDLGPILLQIAKMPPYEGFQGTVPPDLERPAAQDGSYRIPVFSTEQNLLLEDSITVGRWKLIEQAEGDYQHLYDVDSDPLEQSDVLASNPGVSKCLSATLHQFRSNQLAFYSNPALKSRYFPPRYSLAQDPACHDPSLDK